MPLNDDNEAAKGNLTDDGYAQLLADMKARGEAMGEPPCRIAVPADEVDAANARLDAADE